MRKCMRMEHKQDRPQEKDITLQMAVCPKTFFGADYAPWIKQFAERLRRERDASETQCRLLALGP